MINKQAEYFKKIVLKSLIETSKINADRAKHFIANSSFSELLKEDPIFIGHYSPEYWANIILEENSFIRN